MQGQGEVIPDEDRLEDAVAFAGVARFPARVKCALLGWSAFKDAAIRATSGGFMQAEVEGREGSSTDTQQNSHVASRSRRRLRPSDLVRDELPDTRHSRLLHASLR